MSFFLQVTVSGIALGALYTLLGLGFVIIYRATEVVSFAQPALMVFGAYFSVYFATVLGWNFWLALLLAVLVAGAMGGAVERIALRPMVGEAAFSAVMVTIGVDVILRIITNDLLGVGIRQVGDPWGLQTLDIGTVRIFEKDVAAIVITAVVVGALTLFLRGSRYGLGMRATALDQETSMAQGIPVGRMFNLSWVLAGALAAIAGTFVGAGGAGVTQTTWVFALKALPVIILGGLDSIAGAVLGGLIIGLAESYTAAYQPQYASWLGSNFSLVVPYLVMFIVLLVRPYGLFGTPEIERV